MKKYFLLIVLFFNACKSKPSSTDGKLHLGMDRAEANKIFNEYFIYENNRACFLAPGEVQDENNIWDFPTYKHKKSKSILECSFHNDILLSMYYIKPTNNTPIKRGQYFQSLTFDSRGLQSEIGEVEGMRIKRREHFINALEEERQQLKTQIDKLKLVIKKDSFKNDIEGYLKIMKIRLANVEKALKNEHNLLDRQSIDSQSSP